MSAKQWVCDLGYPTRLRQEGEWMLPCGCVVEPELSEPFVKHAEQIHGFSREQLVRILNGPRAR